MGSDNSKCPSASLAEKRYKVERPPIVKSKVSRDKRESCPARKKMNLEVASTSPDTISCPDGLLSPEEKPEEVQAGEEERNEKEEGEESIVSPRSEIGFPSKASDFEGKSHFMSRRERLLIVKSWKKTQKTGAEHVGSKIFLRVLTAQPDIKMIFGLEKIPQGRLKYDPRFRQHALVFTKTFDYLVKNLEFADKLEHHFDTLGRRHVAMQGRGFDPGYWEIFAECMTQTAVEWEQHRHRPTTSAWRSLVSIIITFMRRGYDDELGKRRAFQLPRPASAQLRKTSAY